MRRKGRIDEPTEAAIARAAEMLRAGALVAFPTETVYGLGADAGSDKAVAALYAAKDRPRFNPLIAHVADLTAARAVAELDTRAEALAHAFWPGPLTLVLPARRDGGVCLLARAGLDTVAVRAPAHPIARALLAAFGGPIAAPSANRSGEVSPTEARHVAEAFGDEVEMILDGGACAVGLESTIVDLSVPEPVLLRPGGLPRVALEEVIGPLHSPANGFITGLPTERPTAPGQLARHYAPRLPLRLDAREVEPGEALLAFGPHVPEGAVETLNLSEHGDLVEAAVHLFAYLRRLDRTGARAIAAMPIPSDGLGEAINDRLRRAATPREAAP